MRNWLCLLVLALGLSSCRSWDPEYWSFPVTRRAYVRQNMTGWGETHPGYQGTDPDVEGFAGGEEELWYLPFLLVLPLAIDLVLLPVTGIHDLFLVN